MTTPTQPVFTNCQNCGSCDHVEYACPCACHSPRAPRPTITIADLSGGYYAHTIRSDGLLCIIQSDNEDNGFLPTVGEACTMYFHNAAQVEASGALDAPLCEVPLIAFDPRSALFWFEETAARLSK